VQGTGVGNQCANAYTGDLYNCLEVNVLYRQFLESVHKYLRICDLWKELGILSC
jgi:hypothetical protein